MTRKSKTYLAVIAASLLISAGSIAYRYYENAAAKVKYAAADEQRQITEPYEIPVEPSVPAAEDDLMPQSRMFATPAPGDTAARDSAEVFEEKMTVLSNAPAMKAFNRELMQAIGDIGYEDFVSGNAAEKYFNNPQIQKILLKYSKDPAFMKLVDEVMSDKGLISETARTINQAPPYKK